MANYRLKKLENDQVGLESIGSWIEGLKNRNWWERRKKCLALDYLRNR